MKIDRAILSRAVGILFCLATARADLTLALAPATQSASAGTEAVFSGTITNGSPTDKVFLNDVTATLTGTATAVLTLKSNAFFANVPGILLPGETYSGPLFRVAVQAGALSADYSGSIVFAGGPDIFAAANLGSTGFVVSVIDPSGRHSADTDGDFRLSLLELTRVIELYNTRNGTTRTGCYKVDAAGEDGFAPDPARASNAAVTLAKYHSGDSDRDGKLSLIELTRVIELYNYRSGTTRTGQYHVQAGTEDGFAPGP